MFIIKLGLKNLFRHKKRTFITAIIISLAIFIYLVTDSLMGGLTGLSFDNIINLESGHIQLAKSAYWAEREEIPLNNLMVFDNTLEKEIKELDYYQAHAEELRFSARLNNGVDELPITGIGIKPQQYLKVFKTDDYFIRGSFFKSDKHQAVLGQGLANLMDLGMGDFITLITKTKDGAFNTIDVKIIGLLQTPNPTINENVIYLPMEVVRQGLNIENKISQVKIRLKTDKSQAQSAIKELNQQFRNNKLQVRANSWKDAAREIIAMSQAEKVESSTILGIILLIAAVGIINTTILGALERMEEIGMMKVLGMIEREIIWTFMVEAAGIGIIGGLIGWIFSAIGVGYLKYIGIPLTSLAGSDFNFGMPIVDTL
jgi:putative ABC transport system permease protein